MQDKLNCIHSDILAVDLDLMNKPYNVSFRPIAEAPYIGH